MSQTDRTTTKIIVEDEPHRVETVIAHLRGIFTIAHESKDQHVKLTTHIRRTLRLLIPDLASPSRQTHVVLTERDLRILARAVEAALATGGEDQYLFIYPRSRGTSFALVSKPAYDALAAQGSSQPSPLEGGTEGGPETEPPMP